MQLILTLLLLLFTISSFSQTTSKGSIEYIQDARINALLDLHRNLNEYILCDEDNYQIEGYRVQIFFDSGNNSSTRAKEVKEEFELKFEEIPAYISWKAPNFRVRVGDFRTRLEADGFLNKIVRYYPNAWVIKDEIKYPPID